MENEFPLVSIVIPCRNEERYIGKCLDSIIANDYPKDLLEVLVMDGESKDRTGDIVNGYAKRYPYIKLVRNPKKITASAFNSGIKHAKGEIIVLMGAHAFYAKDYISKCVKYLIKYNADNVGGRLVTVPSDDSYVSKAIAFSLSSNFGSGNSKYKIGFEKFSSVDTVFGGCYRKDVFDKVGLFNENLIRSQDMEFNLRLKKAGGKILFVPDIVAYYYPKASLKSFLKHNFNDGIWAIYPLRFTKAPFKLRHYLPLIFIVCLLGLGILSIALPRFSWLFLSIAVLYLLVTFYFSFAVAKREKNWRYIFLMPAVFFSRHIGYGLGSLWGLFKIMTEY